VPQVGCVEKFLRLAARASITGTLKLENGNPAAKTRVEILRKNLSGDWYATYQFWKQTDEQGRFTFDELPAGDYLLGHEIWRDKPSNYSAHGTRYFP
jgi:hypothetical protein